MSRSMTENEAIEIHIAENIHRIEVIENFMHNNSDADKENCIKNISVLTKINGLLQEIQEYRAIGLTMEVVQEVKRMDAEHDGEILGLIKSLKELGQYRAIGTVKGYERAIQSSIENYNLYKEYKAKVEQFEEIGTVEECKTAVERMKPTKPVVKYGCTFRCPPDCGGEEFDEYGDVYHCPNCDRELSYSIDDVCRCGQAIDWRI